MIWEYGKHQKTEIQGEVWPDGAQLDNADLRYTQPTYRTVPTGGVIKPNKFITISAGANGVDLRS